MNADLSTSEETMMRTMAAAAPVKRRSSFRHYFVTRGWVHLVLLTGVAIFLFPFIWMLGVSFKTEEEVPKADLWPSVPTAVRSSPYTRPPPELELPAAVEAMKSGSRDALVDGMTLAAKRAMANRNLADDLAESAARTLVLSRIGRLNYAAPNVTADQLVAQFATGLTSEMLDATLAAVTATFELRGVYARTFDGQVVPLCDAREIATRWRVVAGAASITPSASGGVIRYDFDKDDRPIVLEMPYTPPAGHDTPEKIVVSYLPDDSWHRIDAEVRVEGRTWKSDRANYLAQNRPASFTFQTASYEDDTFKAKTWTPLVEESAVDGRRSTADAAPESASTPSSPAVDRRPSTVDSAVLRLTISPSSKLGAVWTKATRNYLRAFRSVPFWRYVVNSLCLVVLMTTGAVFSSMFVAYAFARLNWPGRGVAFVILLSTMMLPGQVTMIPSFMIWRALGWYNTLNPLWVPTFFGGAFFVFLMTQQMRTIPKELEEAARIDGLNALQIWWYVIVPLVRPAAAAVAIMTVMGAWNEFMGPLIYLRDQAKFPLSLGLFAARLENADWTIVMAGNVLMTLPMVILFFVFQKHFIQGLTAGGVK